MDTTKSGSTHPATLAARLRALTFCLNRSRFSVIILVVGFALLMSDQGKDLLIAYAEDDKTLRVAASAAFWALSIWGWCRVLLDVRYDDPPSCTSCHNFWRKWMPRVLGALAFIVVAFGAWQVDQVALALWALGGLVVFLVAVIVRRPAARRLAALLKSSRRTALKAIARTFEAQDIGPESVPPYSNLREAIGMPPIERRLAGEKWAPRAYVALAMFLAFLMLAALGNLAPVWLGSHLGAMVLFFVWGGTWLPLGGLMSYVADKHGVPLLTLLAIVSLASSYFNDNHEIRHAEQGVAVASRPGVTDALDAWAEANKANAREATPFVVVATAGGGIRAAYWTATVLGDLQDRSPRFSMRTFGLSGVSGGSVGATVYRALLAIPPEHFGKSCPDGMTGCAQRILGNDFLGPLTAALLYPDLAQRFWPFPWFPDRAAALEESWETAFKNVSGYDELNSSLSVLGDRPWEPALFLNATWGDNGRRIVASNLRYAKDNPDEADAFVRSNDELAVLGYDLRLSTAAHNSARFPFVSPPGMWRHDGEIAGRLQDGGLFENYGAETAMEILDLACLRFSCGTVTGVQNRPRIRPIVILITSDPTLPRDLADSPTPKPIEFAYEIRATLTTYERVRGGRGAEAASRLQEWTRRNNGAFFNFRMCQTDAEAGQPPLGWALSDAARSTINSYLHGATKDQPKAPSCYPENAKASEQLTQLLAR